MDYINQDKLKERIMRRIYLISFFRKCFSIAAIKVYSAVVLFFGLYINVSVADVFKNSLKFGSLETTMINLFNFYKQAFVHTELDVQIISVLLIALASFILIDSIKKLSFGMLKREQRI